MDSEDVLLTGRQVSRFKWPHKHVLTESAGDSKCRGEVGDPKQFIGLLGYHRIWPVDIVRLSDSMRDDSWMVIASSIHGMLNRSLLRRSSSRTLPPLKPVVPI